MQPLDKEYVECTAIPFLCSAEGSGRDRILWNHVMDRIQWNIPTYEFRAIHRCSSVTPAKGYPEGVNKSLL